MVLFYYVTEFQKYCGIRNLFIHKVYFHKFTKRIAVINCIFNAFIGEVEPCLKQVHSQHFLYSFGRYSSLAFGVIWAYKFHPFVPGNYFFHYVEKFFTLRCTLYVSVFYIAECCWAYVSRLVLVFRTCLHKHMHTSFRQILPQTALKILAGRQTARLRIFALSATKLCSKIRAHFL